MVNFSIIVVIFAVSVVTVQFVVSAPDLITFAEDIPFTEFLNENPTYKLVQKFLNLTRRP